MRTGELTRPQRRTLDTLLLYGRPRPVFNDGLAERLRSRIEDELRELPEQVYLTKARLTNAERCEGRFQAALANEGPPFEHNAKTAGGLLVHRAIELEVGGREERDAHLLVATAAQRLAGENEGFAAYWNGSGEIRRDELAMRATGQLVLFRETFPVHAFLLGFDMPVAASIDIPALVLSIAAATAIFRFKLGMLTVLAGSCAAGVALRLLGVI